MLVVLACHEAGNARRGRELDIGVPTPLEPGHIHLRIRLDERASTLPKNCEVLRQLRLRQPTREQQPAVVRDHDDTLPPVPQQTLYAVCELPDLAVYFRR